MDSPLNTIASLTLWITACPAPLEVFTLTATLILSITFLMYSVNSSYSLFSRTGSPTNTGIRRKNILRRSSFEKLSPAGKSSRKLQQLLGESYDPQDPAKNAVAESAVDELEPEDRNRLNYFKSRIDTSDVHATDEILLRMLSARENNVNDGCVMYQRWKDMRVEYKMDELNATTVDKMIQFKTAYFHGRDKMYRPACVILPRNHQPSATKIEEVIQFALWLMKDGTEKADKLMRDFDVDDVDDREYGEICIIYDRRGMTRKNFDGRLFGIMRKLVDVVQICYAERLGKIYVLGTNWFFHLLFKIISPLLSEKTRNKIVILGRPKELLEYFEFNQLERERISDDKEYAKW